MRIESDQHPPLKASLVIQFRRLWQQYAQTYRWYILGVIPLAVLAGLANVVQAYLFQPAIDKVIIEGEAFYLWAIPTVFLIVSLLRGVSVYLQAVMVAYAAENIVAKLQEGVFAKLLRLDIGFFHEFGESPQIGRFLTDIRFIREGAVKLFTELPKELANGMGMLGLMFYHSPLLAVLSLVAMPLFAFPVIIVGKKMRRVSQRTQEEAGKMTLVLDQAMGALRQIKLAGRYDDEADKSSRIFRKMRELMVKIVSYENILKPLNELIKAGCFAVTVVLGGYLVQQGDMSVGALTSFLVALIGLFRPINVLIRINSILQAAMAGMERTFGLLDRPDKVRDCDNAPPLEIVAGEVRFENTQFAYNEDQNILCSLNVTFQGGMTTALVGASGAGKSTVLSLIPRFYDPQAGRVFIDGQDIALVSQASVHRSIAYISQEVELFNLSIFENVRYARSEADREDVRRALEQVGLWAFVAQLPEGLETEIGENGVRLSGGQRQRIAFARALLKDARIILLDEATSALDSESEAHIQQAMQCFPEGATIIVVAHRLSTIRDADRICVLEDGKFVEEGTHRELLVQEGAYAQYYRLQYGQ